MADLAKLIMPRLPPRAQHAAKAVGDVAATQGLGAGTPVPTLDPVSDAVTQLTALQAYFAVIVAGGNPTSNQVAAALAALGAIGADLRALQAQPEPPTASQVWVSGPAAIGVAGVSALVGGVVGWFARGSKEGKR